MRHVTAAELFQALEVMRVTSVASGIFNRSAAGFRTGNRGNITDDTIWTFWVERNLSQKVTRFYLLTPYLASGLTVDDITTAVQTCWKMLDATSSPSLSFYKETKLLIVDPKGSSLNGARLSPRFAGCDWS